MSPALRSLIKTGLVEVRPEGLRLLVAECLNDVLPWNLSEQFLCNFHGSLLAMYSKRILFKLFHK